MTTPWISSIRPTFFFSFSPPLVLAGFSSVADISLQSNVVPLAGRRSGLPRQPLGSGHYFHDLLRDLRLAGAVHLQRQVVDQRAGVLRRVAHGRHPRPVLGGGGL